MCRQLMRALIFALLLGGYTAIIAAIRGVYTLETTVGDLLMTGLVALGIWGTIIKRPLLFNAKEGSPALFKQERKELQWLLGFVCLLILSKAASMYFHWE